jgi:hypothetical protein
MLTRIIDFCHNSRKNPFLAKEWVFILPNILGRTSQKMKSPIKNNRAYHYQDCSGELIYEKFDNGVGFLKNNH